MKRQSFYFLTLTLLSGSVLAANTVTVAGDITGTSKPASTFTQRANQNVYQQLNFSDRQDFLDARQGFIATLNPLIIKHNGITSWDMARYQFLNSEQAAPASVNPSLWRQAQLNNINGLFRVTDRVYQVRGFDLSNITIIEGDTGLILIDPLDVPETARAAMKLYYQHRPHKPIVAVIYSHSHLDHYGGVQGVVSEEDVKQGRTKIFAPEGFMQEASSENIFAGNAMGRRALYMYGMMLPAGPQGQVDTGLGKNVAVGRFTIIAPTDTIAKNHETRTIDGVQIEFMLVPGTEAPAEMMMWFPQFKMLDVAEDVTHNMHNLYTLRGAKVRSSMKWWKALNQALIDYGGKAEVEIAQHHWPVWGNERINDLISSQRDMYKYITDQTLHMINQGMTQDEIAEKLRLPPELANRWANRGYYGSLSHNAKAVYNLYMGWYSSNPADLHPLPEVDAAKKYVELMGGENNVISNAKAAIDKGEYRWAAQLLKHAVFANPKNQVARNLQADAFEQLGYQSENATWRNEYLMGALELRKGVSPLPVSSVLDSNMTAVMSPELLLDYMGISLDGPKAEGKNIKFNWILPDGDNYIVSLRNSVLIYQKMAKAEDTDATLMADRGALSQLIAGKLKLDKAISSGAIKLTGDKQKFSELLGLLDAFPGMFNIVTP